MTGLLFDIETPSCPDIEGLSFVPDFINKDTERALIDEIDQSPWLYDLKRRVQHYGYRYDYKARSVTKDSYIGTLPEWVLPIAQQLCTQGIFSNMPDQLIVNEYQSGQGISAHIDCVPCFGETIASLTLNAGAIMQFQNIQDKHDKAALYLPPCSLVVLSGAARYHWTHAIPARKSDKVDGLKIERGRRISLTFRNMIVDRE